MLQKQHAYILIKTQYLPPDQWVGLLAEEVQAGNCTVEQSLMMLEFLHVADNQNDRQDQRIYDAAGLYATHAFVNAVQSKHGITLGIYENSAGNPIDVVLLEGDKWEVLC